MKDHAELQLRDPAAPPTDDALQQVLGAAYPAYEQLQDALPAMAMEQEWQWYTPYKAWFAKGQHFWTTPRGAKKEKTLYWLYVYDGYFTVAVWFKEKNRQALLDADMAEATKQLVQHAETMGKMPTFPVVAEVKDTAPLKEIYALIDWKKQLER